MLHLDYHQARLARRSGMADHLTKRIVTRCIALTSSDITRKITASRTSHDAEPLFLGQALSVL